MPRDYISAEDWERNAEGEERMPSKDNGPVTERSADETAALLREVLTGLRLVQTRIDEIAKTQKHHEQLIMRLGLRSKAIDERTEKMVRTPANGAPATRDKKTVAPANELDSERGNPLVKNDPKGWQGESYRGKRYSECPADYLEKVAEQLDKFAWFNEKDAAKARGWAERSRKNQPAQAVPTGASAQPSTEENEWG